MGVLTLDHTALVPTLCNPGDCPTCRGGIYTPLAQWELTVSKYHVFFALTHPGTQLSVCPLKGKIATFLPYQAMQHLFQFINYFPAKWEDFGLLEMKFLLSTAASGMCFCGASCAKAQDLLSFVIKPLWYGECAEGVEWEQSSCQRCQSQLFHI